MSKMSAVADSPFSHLVNFRDVGKTINDFAGKRLVAENILFRSASLDGISSADRRQLREGYGIKTVMDLRTRSELEKQAKKRELSSDGLAQPAKIPGIDYLEINLNGPGFERSLLKRLSYWSYFKLIILMILGYRVQGMSIVTREVIAPRGLMGLGYDSLDFCGPEIAQALREFASASRYPILYHCTLGKDRTGLLTALMLFFLDVPADAIKHDYTLSEGELLQDPEQRIAMLTEVSLPREFSSTPTAWVGSMQDHLNQNYGGIREYLVSIGFGEEDQARLLEVLQG